MKNRNFVYDGWKANGFVALACELVLLAGFIALIVWGACVPMPCSRAGRG